MTARPTPMSYEDNPIPTPLTDVVERTPSLRRAYVLFMDIVGFAKLPTDHQVAAQRELGQIVQMTPEVASAKYDPESLLVRQTGDGIALMFFKDLLSPLRCALQLHGMIQADNTRLKQLIGTPLKLRMGVHAGEVTIVQDVNGQRDAAGDGIITAQRVMDLGDADHILLSSEVAKVLIDMDPWARYITHLGEVRVKHKIIVDIYNLYGRLDGPFCGNPGTPKKVVEDGRARSREAKALRPRFSDVMRPHWGRIFALMFIGGLAGSTYYAYQKYPKPFKLAYAKFEGWLSSNGKSNPGKAGAKPTKPGGGNNTGKPNVTPTANEAGVVRVPDLMGRETHEADTVVQGEGLRMKIVMGDFTKFPENTVYKQSPPAGSRIPRGGTVSATISRGIKGASVEYPTDGTGPSKDNPETDPDATPDKTSSPSGDPADN